MRHPHGNPVESHFKGNLQLEPLWKALGRLPAPPESNQCSHIIMQILEQALIYLYRPKKTHISCHARAYTFMGLKLSPSIISGTTTTPRFLVA